MYAKGLRAQAAEALVKERERGGSFAHVDDLEERLRTTRKVDGMPGLTRTELVQLARIGALNSLGEVAHRRDALWQVEQAGRPAGPLLSSAAAAATQPGARRIIRRADDVSGSEQSGDQARDEPQSPLAQMTTEERLVADFGGTGLTTGPHPMAYKRAELRRERILSSAELAQATNGSYVRTAGCVIARQRPGTASGFIFLSLEDESGIANIIIHPELYERQRLLVMGGKFLLVEGRLQNEDRVVHVRAEHVAPLSMARIETRSHDFH
jgi:error-prone DNA polymerase